MHQRSRHDFLSLDSRVYKFCNCNCNLYSAAPYLAKHTLLHISPHRCLRCLDIGAFGASNSVPTFYRRFMVTLAYDIPTRKTTTTHILIEGSDPPNEKVTDLLTANKQSPRSNASADDVFGHTQFLATVCRRHVRKPNHRLKYWTTCFLRATEKFKFKMLDGQSTFSQLI